MTFETGGESRAQPGGGTIVMRATNPGWIAHRGGTLTVRDAAGHTTAELGAPLPKARDTVRRL